MSFDSTMFEAVVDEATADEVLSSAMKGIYGDFIVKLNDFYPGWREANPDAKPYVLGLTTEGGPFAGKTAGSVYQSMNNALKSKELKSEWRVVKRVTGKDKDDNNIESVFITKL